MKTPTSLFVTLCSAIFATLLLTPTFASAQTEVYGTLLSDTTWNSSGSPYLVSYTAIPSGVTLTIEAGTIVKFSDVRATLEVSGNLVTAGTAINPVYFTSINDNSVGGSTGTGTPAPADWGNIIVMEGGTANINHAVIRYGGYTGWQLPTTNSNLYNRGGTLTVSNSFIGYTSSGLTHSLGITTLQSNVISENSTGIFSNGTGKITFTENTFLNNTETPAFIDLSPGIEFAHSGNIATGNQSGFYLSGMMNSDYVFEKDTMPYVIGNIEIPAGRTITVRPGATFKFASIGSQVRVSGKLNAPGTAAEPIYFTSIKDDTILGDTNGDGNATVPAPTDWAEIQILSGGEANFDHAVVRYGGQYSWGIWTNSSNISNQGGVLNILNSDISNGNIGVNHLSGITTIATSTISKNSNGLFAAGSGSLSFANTTFSDNTAAIYFDISNGLAFANSGTKMTGAGERGIALRGVAASDQILEKDTVPYLISNLSIPTGRTLTVRPGAVIKMTSIGAQISVAGTLNALGTKAEPIYFTSLKDDTILGDTNSDGNATAPAPTDWAEIAVTEGGVAHFTYTIIRYGGQYSWGIWTNNAELANRGGTLDITNSQITYGNIGVYNSWGTTTVSQSSIHDNSNSGILNADSAKLLHAENNWWGGVSGPYHPLLNVAGIGNDQVSDNVAFAPWLSGDPFATSSLTLENPTETEDDNNQDTKGVADKTNFTFSVTIDGAPDSVNLIVGSETGTTTLPLTRTTLVEYVATSTFPKGKYTWHIEATAGGQTVQTSDRNFTTGYSNVAFLPGIMGSRLFEQSSICAFATEEEHWVSRNDCDHKRLALDASGKSIYPLYTKEGAGGAIDDTYGFNIYQSFMSDLEKWKNTDHIIADYKIIPYDWRLSLEDILQNGATTTDGRLSYGESQGFYSSYIYKQIRALQESSDTGKVSIIAHSNGGLVAKAFVQKLKDNNDTLANQIDDIVMVAVPQAGTPDAIGGLLHGTKLGHGVVMGKERSRDLLHNMPVGYNLLPSRAFPVSSADPFIEFTGDSISSAIRLRYGDNIDTYTELTDYLLGGDGRSAPAYDDTNSPAIANENLLFGADAAHAILDHFAPGNGTTVYEIAGWGRYTPAGVRYRKNRECIRVTETFSPIGTPRPLHCAEYRDTVKIDYRDTINGDATVTDKSAHLMPESATTKKFWVNLEGYNTQPRTIDREHRDILEVDILRPFIKSLIVKNISTPELITNDSRTLVSSGAYVKYEIHSPLNINAYDAFGNHTGVSTTTGLVEEGIEGSQYLELGDSKAIIVPAETAHVLNMDAYASGSFTLDIETLAGDTITAGTTFEAVPTATTTKAAIPWNPETGIGSSTLDVDFNADNIIDTSLAPVINGTALYDITPPEAVISFSTTTNDIIITGRDAGGETTIQTAATRTTITDQAGNTLVIPFTKYKEKSTKLKIVFDTLVYNGVATIIPKTTLEYEWELKNRILKELKQDVRIKNTRRVSTEYETKNNNTKITDKVKEEGEKSITKSTKPGIAILTISTRDGVVGVQY